MNTFPHIHILNFSVAFDALWDIGGVILTISQLSVRCPACFSPMNVKVHENGKSSGLCNHCHSLITEQRTEGKRIIKIVNHKK